MTPDKPRQVAYLVSRFPSVSETFVVREMNEVAAVGRQQLRLLSLFSSSEPSVHDSARRWESGARRPGKLRSLAAVAGWMVRRPVALGRIVAELIAAYGDRPAMLARSLATLGPAAVHARSASAEGVDHIHAHFAAYPALAALICKRLAGIPYSFTAHAYDIFVEQAMLPAKVSEAEFVVTISEFNREFITRHCPDSETPLHVVHCGIDPSAYEFRPRRPAESGPVRATCVAGLEVKKGHAVLLEAIAADPRLERLHLELVGDGPLRAELEAATDRLGLRGRVCFHGALSEVRVAELLAGSDLFVLPSIVAPNGMMEGLPVALMEAVAAGLPVVSTRLSGIPELIEDGRIGLLAEPGDPTSLADALVQLVDDPGSLDLQAGRKLIEQEFDIATTGTRMAELLSQAPGRATEA